MTQPLNLGNCCGPSVPGLRKITFPDGDQVGLIGLDAVMDALYREGKVPDDATVAELINRLREKITSAIPPPSRHFMSKHYWGKRKQ